MQQCSWLDFFESQCEQLLAGKFHCSVVQRLSVHGKTQLLQGQILTITVNETPVRIITPMYTALHGDFGALA